MRSAPAASYALLDRVGANESVRGESFGARKRPGHVANGERGDSLITKVWLGNAEDRQAGRPLPKLWES